MQYNVKSKNQICHFINHYTGDDAMTGHALLRSVLFLLMCLGNKPDSRITHTKDLLNIWPNRKLLIHGIHADLCGGSTEFVPEGNHVTPVRSSVTTTRGLVTLTMGKTIRPKKHLEARVLYYGNSDAAFNPMAFTIELSGDVHPQPGPTSLKSSAIPVITTRRSGHHNHQSPSGSLPLYSRTDNSMTKQQHRLPSTVRGATRSVGYCLASRGLLPWGGGWGEEVVEFLCKNWGVLGVLGIGP